jgi:hypothetical protein
MEQHTHAAFTEAKRLADFPMIGAFHVGEPHHLALLRLELLKHTDHVKSLRHVRRRRGGCGRIRLGGMHRAPPAPPLVGHEIAGDAKQERPELLRIGRRRRHAQQSQIAVLHDVVDLREVPQRTRDVGPQRPDRSGIERHERLLIHRSGVACRWRGGTRRRPRAEIRCRARRQSRR